MYFHHNFGTHPDPFISRIYLQVGPQSSGKTSLVQYVSQITGHRLHVFAMNSAMDTTELLGGFEQVCIDISLQLILPVYNIIN